MLPFYSPGTRQFWQQKEQRGWSKARSRTRSRKLLFHGLAAVALGGPCFSLPLLAQIDTGVITGTVKDSTGAILPGVTITLTNDATHVAAGQARTTPSGTYVFDAVQPGTYTIHLDAQGFKRFEDQGLKVDVQHTSTVDITLAAGDTQQQVTVTAAAPLLQAEDATIAQTIDAKTINSLPLNGRDWVSLAQLSAGVSTAPMGQPSSNGGSTGAAFFAVDGVSLWQNDIRLDGIDDNIEFYGGSSIGTNATITPPPDAIEEFTLQSGDFNAQFGHSTGAVVNAVIRSGTDHFHGNAWEYWRNDAVDANDFFTKRRGLRKPEYRFNQFGATIGGPLRIPGLFHGQDKTFFFADYQGTRIVEADSSTTTVPTSLMQSSNFTNLQDLITDNHGTQTDGLGRVFPLGTILDPETTRAVQPGAADPVTGLMNSGSAAVYVRDPFYAGGSLQGKTNFTSNPALLNMLPAGRIDPNAVKLFQLYPSANQAGFTNNYLNNARETQDLNGYDIRVDHTISERDMLFGVFDRSYITYVVPGALPGIAVGQSGGENQQYPAYAVALGYTHVFTPTMTNELTFGLGHSSKDQNSFYGTTYGIPAQFGIQGVPQISGNGGLPAIDPTGLSNLGVISDRPTIQTVRDIEVIDNVTKLLNSHTIRFGAQVDLLRGDILQPRSGKGVFTFSGEYSDVPNKSSGLNGVADTLLTPGPASNGGTINMLGGLSSFSGSNYGGTDDSRQYIGTYLQDDWKATPSLTVNLGIRWDYFSPYVEIKGRQANFLPVGGNGSSASFLIPQKTCNASRSAGFDSLLASSNIQLQCVPGLTLGNAQKSNFAPRIGFANRITPAIVVRGGYGIAYGALGNLGYGGTLGTNYPFEYVISQTASNSQTPISLSTGQTATLENTLTTINLSDPTQVSGANLSLYGRQYNYATPYTETYNLTVQDQFTKRDSIQVGFVGTLGRHLDNLGTTNAVSEILPPGTNYKQYIPYPDFAPSSTYETTNGRSNYNSLQTTYTHQFGGGLSLLANYTYSKCMTDQKTQATSNGTYRAEWLPGFGIDGDMGLCDVDAANVVHVSGSYQLPVGRGRSFAGSANRIEDAFLGGWSLNYIYSYQSGQPFTVGCPVATTATFGCNADVVPGQALYNRSDKVNQWLNPNAFAQPAIATQIGQLDYSPLGGSPQQVRGPGFNNLDSSLFKQFPMGEERNLQIRVESFNTLNNPQFGQPGSLNFANTTSFSSITTLRNNPRLLQFAAKFGF
jgi:hypothetical protein